MSHDQRDLKVTYLRNLNFQSDFVDFRPTPKVTVKQVSLIFPPLDNRGQKNEQSECLLRPQLFIPTVPV